METDVKDPNYELGEKAVYVMVNGVKYAIVRTSTPFDQIGAANALRRVANRCRFRCGT
jgi:hypothetical protein